MTPHRPKNAELRTREYLTIDEIELLTKAAGKNKAAHRDATMIMICYRHGFRASELIDLRWDQIDFRSATIAIRRCKSGTPATHPIQGDELRALRRLQREQTPVSPFVFTTARKGPFAEDTFAKLIDRLGKKAGIGFKVHPHMLRHSCGFTLANNGTDTRLIQGWLGHVDIQHTVVYTELAPGRFNDIRGMF
jgi:integrase